MGGRNDLARAHRGISAGQGTLALNYPRKGGLQWGMAGGPMARFDNGWVKLYRRALESDLGQNVYLWAIWTTLLSWATRTEQKRLFDGEQRVLPAGTVIFGMTEMAQRWGCSKVTARKWLRYLASSERITLEVRTKGCVATICNWDEYQNDLKLGLTDDEPATNDELKQGERQVPPNGEDKKKRSNTRRSRVDYEPAFEEVYKTYPRQEGKSKGYKIWEKLTPEEKEQLKTAVANYSNAKAGKDAEYLKHFSTFMGEWSDWVNPSAGQPQKPKLRERTLEEVLRGI